MYHKIHLTMIHDTLPIAHTRDTIEILGIPFNNVTKQEMLSNIENFSAEYQQKNMFIVTANPEIAYYAKTHENYLTRIKAADYIVPDGIGIIKAAKYLKTPLKERIPGIELMEAMLGIADRDHKRVFLLGGSKETVKKCKKKLREKYPGITFKSKHGYKDIHDHKTLKKIKAFEPDFVFVAMGYPKQESYIYYNQHHFSHTVFMGVGGSFDVFSGNVKRAPEFFIKTNMEWLYRIMTDFRRFKRAVAIPLFLIQIVKQKYVIDNDPHAHFKDKD
ncbi:WecB/TagA/CpsF family glycosyltransferase [Macrococcus lamae]|uniref:N-acetylglucosaminyldiphosphoundecaprenol N-acetyl-beta-D-mannosaminyltransferase n=1 Tax=Macrococcus lamae TaxID=198484 RepID=A0A4R6BVL9_9STAP|nr:WecB/TagA/CpsF family glycosyltransferase [Macrococcus lamae]TDM12411.1 glycosyltransferase [Macrococcus lamae]